MTPQNLIRTLADDSDAIDLQELKSIELDADVFCSYNSYEFDVMRTPCSAGTLKSTNHIVAQRVRLHTCAYLDVAESFTSGIFSIDNNNTNN